MYEISYWHRTIELVELRAKERGGSHDDYMLDSIFDRVINHYKITKEDLLSKKRKIDFCKPRQICIWLIKKRTKLTLYKIADLFGKDHATIIHAINKINDLIDSGDHYGITAKRILQSL